jgi:cell division protein FtsI (penicillin-binding protein 3)
MSLKKDILWRVGIIYLVIFLLTLSIVGKILYLNFVKGDELSQKAKNLTLKDITIESNRGDIYASGNRLLASSIPYYEIRMDLASTTISEKVFGEKADSLALCLSRLFKDRTPLEYKKELTDARINGERYYLIKRKVNYNQLQQLKKFPIFRLGRYKGGFIYEQVNRRILPHNNLASRTIGYLTRGNSGNVVGIEGAYDHELMGRKGIRLMQKLSGNVWMPVKNGNEIEPKDGNDVVTTIDVNIQDVAENALLKQLKQHNAHHGTAVLMEVQTGDIKAIVNLEKDKNGAYRELYNYAIGESTEPGSTFKLVSLIVALEDGKISLNDTVDTGNGEITYYDKSVRDTKKGGYGKITIKQAFEVSSNVGISKVIYDNYKGKERHFIDRLYAMNLNEKLGIEIKGEGTPDIKYPGDKYWSGISLPMISHGYEIRLTPLQILAFYNAIANEGKMVRPRFVKEICYHGEVLKSFDSKLINPSICSAETIKKAKYLLEGVVENGTAKNLKNSSVKIAGKTGTAQIANEKYGYKLESKISYTASFVGYFPVDNPKYSCIVVINSPSNSVYYGNLVAGPVFKEIADKVYATSLYMQVRYDNYKQLVIDPPYSKHGNYQDLMFVLKTMGIDKGGEEITSDWIITTRRDSFIELTNLQIRDNFVPNVMEMGMKDALYLLESKGLKVIVKGRGKVKNQSIPPGTLITRGTKIILEMSFV